MDKNSTKRLVLTLSVIGIVSALILTFVYEWTTPYIQANQAEKQRLAIQKVLPEAEKVKEVEKNGYTFYEGYDSTGNRVGVAFQHSGGGYNGIIKVMIGVDLDEDRINRISIINHEETPGLGARITGEEYKSNYIDKPFGDYTVVKTPTDEPLEIQAIAGATISSDAVAKIVESGVKIIDNAYGGGN